MKFKKSEVLSHIEAFVLFIGEDYKNKFVSCDAEVELIDYVDDHFEELARAFGDFYCTHNEDRIHSEAIEDFNIHCFITYAIENYMHSQFMLPTLVSNLVEIGEENPLPSISFFNGVHPVFNLLMVPDPWVEDPYCKENNKDIEEEKEETVADKAQEKIEDIDEEAKARVEEFVKEAREFLEDKKPFVEDKLSVVKHKSKRVANKAILSVFNTIDKISEKKNK